jgi:hypothetical protein
VGRVANKKGKEIQTRILGIIETTMYFYAFTVFGNNIDVLIKIVGGYIAIKLIPKFSVWNEKNIGKERFNIFLIGNGLNIINTYIACLAIRNYHQFNYIEAMVAYVFLLVFLPTLHWWLRYQHGKWGIKTLQGE